ncbi:unnamed protein product [Ambrosiozyma monospora]|uniref:Unnamed protein product n=1 Tax=Ambrosiozyma monospora TaxID=43982 RepID=A0ACB5TYL6_AMBMO|nr:unnamed protein product [Ambrosiozyma monospora]
MEANHFNCHHNWSYDDFTPCARHQILQATPFYLSIISLSYVIARLLSSRSWKSKTIKSTSNTNEETEPLLAQNTNSISTNFQSIEPLVPTTKPTKSLIDSHFDISNAKFLNEKGQPLATLQVKFRDSTSEKLKVIVESLLLLTQFSISLLPILHSTNMDISQEWALDNTVPYLTSIFWGYLLLIGILRLSFVTRGFTNNWPDLWQR